MLSARIVNLILSHFIVDIEATRLWLMSFDLHYFNSSKNEKWKTQIDSAFAERDWYLLNKNRWGNEQYVCHRAVLYYLLEMVIMLGGYLYVELFAVEYIYVWSLLDCALFFPPLVLINYTYWISPKELNDNLYFRFEYRTTAGAMCLGWAVFVSSALAETFGWNKLSVLLAVTAYVSAGSAPSLLSTIWIPMKVKLSSVWVWFVCVEFIVVHSRTRVHDI